MEASASRRLRVSIPPWFDFAVLDTDAPNWGQVVSIPPWFDFALAQIAFSRCCIYRFNPTLVRFCHALMERLGARYVPFQSHLGSILPRTTASSVPRSNFVSIPPWFDFALLRPILVLLIHLCFNPTLVRFCRNPASSRPSHAKSFNPTLVRFCHNALCKG